MSLPSYKSYKQTQSAWLTRIPEHWDMGQSRRRFRLRNEQAMEGDEQLTASQKYGVIKQADFIEAEGRRVVEVIKGQEILKHVEPGDFVISMRSFQGGLEYSRVGGSISSAYVMLAPIKQVWPDFFSWLFKSQPYIQALQSTSNLVRDGQALRFSNFSQVDIPIIPDSEQLAIARFLDRETTKIDALIVEQERLIELLQEKRQAVISHAVTKGLNPDAPMKDSGVEWLGEVPEHWRTTRLGHHAKAKGGTGFPDEYQGNTEAEFAFLKVANLGNNDSLATTDGYEHTISKETAVKLRAEVHKKGSIVFAKVGAALLLERYKFLAQNSCIDNNMMVVVNDEKIITNAFLRHCLSTVRLEMIVNPGAVPSINAAQVHGLMLAFPPAREQNRICDYIEEETQKIDDLLSQSKVSIQLLKERRSALISAAVTGQIDVRGLVPGEDAT